MAARKRLGQHFMVSSKLAKWIVDQLEIEKGDVVLEIGPGRGALTEQIPGYAELVCIEIDRRMAPYLEGRNVFWGDALEIEWPEFDRIISNLPYQISSGVFSRLVGKKFKKGVFGLQKEFAERLVGKGKRSRLTATADFAFQAEILKTVGKGATSPPSGVEMAIVSVKPKKLPENWENVKRLIDLLFVHPRKTVRSALRDEGIEFEGGLAKKRVRKLSPQELAELAEEVFD